jgi:hypothetical protein
MIAALTITTKPTPAEVRQWMQQRQVERTPPPTPEEIRRQLSWHLEPNNEDKCAECAR